MADCGIILSIFIKTLVSGKLFSVLKYHSIKDKYKFI